MIQRLQHKGATLEDQTDVYIKHVRSILEFGVPVWNGSLTKAEIVDIERVQKTFMYIVLGNNYINYESALDKTQLETLENRRMLLCIKFAQKASKHPKHKNWFCPNTETGPNTRSDKTTYKTPLSRLSRFKKSPIPYLTDLLNTQ